MAAVHGLQFSAAACSAGVTAGCGTWASRLIGSSVDRLGLSDLSIHVTNALNVTMLQLFVT